MSDILVFITATINCGNTPLVKRSDPGVRTQDYLRGFRSWLTPECKADIVFCENSGADLTDFRNAAARFGRADYVCFLSFSGNGGAERFGKGYGEIEILVECLGRLRRYSRRERFGSLAVASQGRT
jgi:hypothetical protein